MRRLRVAPALVYGDHPGAQLERLLDVVGDHQDGQPVLAPQLVDQRMHVEPHARVEGPEGFVEQQDPRVGDERLGDRQPLLHPPGQSTGVGAQVVAEAHPPKHLGGLAPRVALVAAALQAEHDVLQHGHVREDRVALEHHPALGAGLRRQRLAIEHQPPAGGAFLSQCKTQEGALAGARGADDRHEGAFGHVQGKLLEDDPVAVLDPDVTEREDAHQCLLPTCAQGKAARLIEISAQSIATASSEIQAT